MKFEDLNTRQQRKRAIKYQNSAAKRGVKIKIKEALQRVRHEMNSEDPR